MNHVKRILIVGGGVAGWMAAAYLQRQLGTACTVTLLESVKLGTAGVGEGSDPALVRFLSELGLPEHDFMRECSATFKLGTRFDGWLRDGHQFWLPYSLPNTINDFDLFHFWLKGALSGGKEPYATYSLQAQLAERDLAPRPLRGPSPVVESGAYAYHLDTATFADFLREVGVAAGVIHLFDDVRTVQRDDTGAISRIETKSGRSLAADLYVDCSGEIVEQTFGDPWLDWSSFFPCDRMVIVPLPRDPRMRPYTQATALSAGWMWQVPLSHRVGCGYVYSSAHISADAAARELVAKSTTAKAAVGELRHLKLRSGRRQIFWLKNCVALGQAAGAVEPLHAVDTLIMHKGLSWLLRYLPGPSFNPLLVQTFNRRMADLFDTVRDFLFLHYLSQREEPFWRDRRSATLPNSLRALLALHDEAGLVEPEWTAVLPESSYHHLFAGVERLPRRPLAAADAVAAEQIRDILGKIRAQNESWLAKMPSHRELMEAVHRPPV
jgi:tryptophan halogenase